MQAVQIALECADALSALPFNESYEHILAAGEQAIQAQELSSATVAALREALDVLGAESRLPYPFRPMRRVSHNTRPLADRLRTAALGSGVPHLYHGTIFGRLESIVREGLRPGAEPVWKSDDLLRARSDTTVFLTDTWRGAARWAHCAHLFAKGPRAGRGRYPVILRVRAEQLAIEPDNLATGAGCFMVSDQIPARSIEILLETGQPLPVWESLHDAFGRLRRESRLDQAGLINLMPDEEPVE